MSELPSLGDAPLLKQAEVRAVFALLDQGGDRGRVVGGAVRDALLGRKADKVEVDFATTATPDQVTARAEAGGVKVVPTGIEHGTVTLILGGHAFQVTTLREDVETDGRHAIVRFGKDWEADAHRRDFTINALSVEADGTLHDPVGGYPDIVARRVRFIGDPDRRIAEDRLRILRFFRFHAECGAGAIDAAGLDAAARARDGIRALAAERISHELCRLLLAAGAADAVETMQHAGIMPIILAGVGYLARFRRMIDFERDADLSPSFARRLAALAVRIAEDEIRVGERLKLSNNQRETIRNALAGLREVTPPSERQARILAYRSGRGAFTDGLALAAAEAGGPTAGWARALRPIRDWEPPVFPLGGTDALGAGIPRGPAVGEVLKRLEEWWIAEDFRPDKRALLNRLQQIHAAQQ